MKKSVVVLLVSLALIGLLVACGGGSSGTTYRFLFAANNGPLNGTGTITEFSIDRNTGALSNFASETIPNNDTPETFAMTSDGKFLFAAADNGIIAGFSIDNKKGLLPNSAGSIYLGSGCGYGLALSQDNKYLFIPDHCNNKIYAYSLAADGTLTAVTNSPFTSANLDTPKTAAVDRTNKYLYAANESDGKIVAFSIATDGQLTEVSGSPFTGPQGTHSIVASRKRDVLYAADELANSVVALSINTQTGALSAVSGSPFSAGTGTGTIALGPAEDFLFATNYTANTLSVFQVGSGGALTPAGGSPVTLSGIHPNGVAVDSLGQYVYVSDYNNPGKVEAFKIGSGGALSPVDGSPFTAGPFTAGLQASK